MNGFFTSTVQLELYSPPKQPLNRSRSGNSLPVQIFVKIIDVQHHPLAKEPPLKKVEEHFSFMEKFGIDYALLSCNMPHPEDSNVPYFQRMNDAVIERANSYPERFLACPSIPIHSSRAALSELERLISATDLRAAKITPIMGRIDYEELDPFYEKLCNLDVPVLVHPTFSEVPYKSLWSEKFHLNAGIGFAVDSTLAISWMIMSGFLDRFPQLKLVIHHLGGAAPFALGRLEVLYDECEPKASKRPSEYMKMLYLDTVCYDLAPLELSLKVVGADHLMFGTDYGCPSKALVDPPRFLSQINSLDISGEDKANILGGNAARVFGLQTEKIVPMAEAGN